jgi:hypothetical protein
MSQTAKHAPNTQIGFQLPDLAITASHAAAPKRGPRKLARRMRRKQANIGLNLIDVFGLNSAQQISDPGAPIRVDYTITPHNPPPEGRVWVPYETVVKVAGTRPHPGLLMQTRSLYAQTPHVPMGLEIFTLDNLLNSGAVSDIQYEAVVMAEARHQQFHSLIGERRYRSGFGAFMGTGTGKTAFGIASYVHNKLAGRPVALFLTANEALVEIYFAEMQRLGLETSDCLVVKGQFADDIASIDLNETPVLFATYASLRNELWQCTPERLENVRAKHTDKETGEIDEFSVRKAIPRTLLGQALAEKLGGETFEGLVLCDEADEVGGARAYNGKANRFVTAANRSHKSDQGQAFAIVDERLPNARFVTASASGIPRIQRIAYCAERLNLVGEGTPFETVHDLQHELADASFGAMEGFLMDAYSRGIIHSVAVSFDNSEYAVVETHLSEAEFLAINEYVAIFAQIISHIERFTSKHIEHLQEVKDKSGMYFGMLGIPDEDRDKALESLKHLAAHLKGRRNYVRTWLFERWLRHLLLNVKEESVARVIEQELDAGRSVILQIADTGAAEVNRQLDMGVIPDSVCTSHKAYLKTIANVSISATEQNLQWDKKKRRFFLVPQLDDFDNPVVDTDAEKVIRDIHDSIDAIIDDHDALFYLYSKFGPDAVGEVSNRSHIVYETDKGVQTKARSASSENRKAINDFNDGKKRILIISRAGYRGINLHNDRKFKNQQQRAHIIYDATDRPELFLQALGRSNRSNQICNPKYIFLPSNLPFDQAAMSILIHKLSETGALSYGDSRSTHTGMLCSDFNLLDFNGIKALGRAIQTIYKGQNPEIPADLWSYFGGEESDADLGDKWNQEQRKTAKHAYLTMARLPLAKDGGIQRRFLDSVIREREKLRSEAFGRDDASAALPRIQGEKIVLHSQKSAGANSIIKTFTIEEPKGIYSTFGMAYDYYTRHQDSAQVLLSVSGEPMVCRTFDDGSVFVITPADRSRRNSMPLGEPLSREHAEVLWTQQYEKLERWRFRRTIISGNVTACADLFRDDKKAERKRLGLYTRFVEVVASDGTHHFGKVLS